MTRGDLSLSEARRIALAAQALDRPRPRGRVDARHVRRIIRGLGLLQLDYVNVLVPAHYLVLFSRLGPYETTLLDDLVYRRREFTEQWAREASIVPAETWPLLRHRMDLSDRRGRAIAAFMERNAAYVGRVLELVRARGPLTREDVPEPEREAANKLEWWGWTASKAALEGHFARGTLAVADRRRSDFARAYDLAQRVLPPAQHRRRVDREAAQSELVRLAARALGVGTAGDLADYYRIPIREARTRAAELVAAGELRQVSVESWHEPAFLHADARLPRRVEARALLSPFDPLVWHRPRVQRLFEFEYLLEIWVPQAKRRWGYYVLPFLRGERLVARVDLKADRRARRLLVLSAYLEPGADPRETARALASELKTVAGWLGLERVRVGRRGDFARPLAAAFRG